MNKFFLGVIVGILLLTTALYTRARILGAVPSNGDFLGIYNATTTDLVLQNGYGSAFAVDSHGRLIATSTPL